MSNKLTGTEHGACGLIQTELAELQYLTMHASNRLRSVGMEDAAETKTTNVATTNSAVVQWNASQE